MILEISKSCIPNISKQIHLLEKEEKYEEALELCELYENSVNVQAQRVKILFKIGRVDEAMSICNLPKLKYESYVQQQKIAFLIKCKRYDEASDSAFIQEFDDCLNIQKLRAKILKCISDCGHVFEPSEDNKESVKELKIKDVFKEEIDEIKIYLYVNMIRNKSKRYIDVFNRFYYLIEKNVFDKNALDIFIYFAKEASKSSYALMDISKIESKRISYSKSRYN